MIKRFLLILGAVSLFSVLTAAPAFAATVRFVPPSPNGGQTVTGTQTIQVEATPDSLLGTGLAQENIEGLTVTVRPRSDAGGSAREYRGAGSTLRVSWETPPLYNGGYDIEAVATSQNGGRAVISNVRVNNPPAKPSGLKAVPEGNAVAISWTANKEPDLIGYEVRRSVGDESFSKLADVKAASYKDTTAPADQRLRYQVIASRRSASGGSIDSAPSDASSPLTIAPPAPGPAPAPAAAAPAPAAAAPAAPAAKPAPSTPAFARTGFKTLPARDLGFEPTLPFTAPIPQKFEPPTTDGRPSSTDSNQFSGTLTQVHPARFLAAGLLLLVISAHLARASRRLLKSGGTPSRGGRPVSPVRLGT
jgi:hypothetical protein